MSFPKYNGDSTVNLIASIQSYCWINSKYDQLSLLGSTDLSWSDNVILCLIDAMWYNWMEKYAKDSFLYKHLKWSIKSAFPSTTSTAITTFSTWTTPSEHAILGWNMFSKEVWWTIQILPWKHKILWTPLWDYIKIDQLATERNFYNESNKEIYIVTNQSYKDSNYNKFYNKDSLVLGYRDLPDFFSQIENSICASKEKKYIYAYWWDFDSLSHNYGIDSSELKKHFEQIDYWFELFSKKIEWTNTKIVVTADHGQLDIPKEKKIDVSKEFPELVDMLSVPLSWEPRCQYCFVRTKEHENFRKYVEEKMSHLCSIYSTKEVLEQQIFGFWRNKKFLERVGDYILVAKDNYALFHTFSNDWMYSDLGFHGWITDWETLVPLIVI